MLRLWEWGLSAFAASKRLGARSGLTSRGPPAFYLPPELPKWEETQPARKDPDLSLSQAPRTLSAPGIRKQQTFPTPSLRGRAAASLCVQDAGTLRPTHSSEAPATFSYLWLADAKICSPSRREVTPADGGQERDLLCPGNRHRSQALGSRSLSLTADDCCCCFSSPWTPAAGLVRSEESRNTEQAG